MKVIVYDLPLDLAQRVLNSLDRYRESKSIAVVFHPVEGRTAEITAIALRNKTGSVTIRAASYGLRWRSGGRPA